MDSTGPDLDPTGLRPYLLQVMWIPSGMDRPDLDSIVPAWIRSGFDMDWIFFVCFFTLTSIVIVSA